MKIYDKDFSTEAKIIYDLVNYLHNKYNGR